MSFNGHMQRKQLNLNDERVVFRRIHGRVIPVRIGIAERLKNSLKGAVVPAVVAATLGEGLAAVTANRKAGRSMFKASGIAQHFMHPQSLKNAAKVAGLAVAFSVGYNLLFGKRQRHVIELEKKPNGSGDGKARIWLGSKPGFLPGHHLGEHSYLHVRDKYGKVTRYGGQIKNALAYGKSGVKVSRNFPTDRIGLAHNVHDLTPHTTKEANAAVSRLHREADKLAKQLKAKDYKYRSIPIKAQRYNSNSVTGTIIRRAQIPFSYSEKRHNMPGFTRSIPKE